MDDALSVGRRLVALCNAGKNVEAVETLYAEDVVSEEVMGFEGMPARMEGKAAVLGKNKWWMETHEIHSSVAEGPWPHGDRFIVKFKLDATAKVGPMAGQRMQMEEAALYRVRGGKVVEEAFFYAM